ncbi:amidohydrolase family protein [Roseovarius sp. SCSIO 43702]|uniref:amidohydrolase family protein n=1 Tax=Roseovarius sp. SCSIO 43702 TaxID=2823043 RepID=UPI001C73270A|nr:amidohydrolase family protein [Roseovarius sp. SCSIO 43702]QYX57186.1 amidohydrolase family protein [Roseovarius sp. SCSIO 43702]
MAGTTVIRNASWIVAWDEDAGRHTYLQDADVAFEGDCILQVGGRFEGEVAREIDGKGRLVSPGLVNIHSHPLSEPMNKGFLDELGSPRLYMSSLYEFMPLFRPDAEGTKACTEVALSELLLSGVTTLTDLSVPYDPWIDLLDRSGIRAVLAPMYRSARWYTKNGHVVEYEWDEKAGREAMDAAMKTIDAANAHPSGRMSGMVSPSQIDTCSADLIRDSFAEAQSRGIKFQIHAAQSVVEFHEITRRHGKTPLEWLDSLGVLKEGAIIGHGIFLNTHSMVHWPEADDFALLRDSGAAVAHCPTVFQRRGIAMQSVGKYIRGGIPVGIGTDTYPHNMLEELRNALYISRLMTGNPFDIRTHHIFDAATVGGAAILGRDDIGKLAKGAKADLFMADINHPAMRPVRDPLRSLIYVAGERAVRDVFVDGRQVVADGKVEAFDLEDATARLEEAQRRAEEQFRQLDFAGRSHLEASPLAYEVGK